MARFIVTEAKMQRLTLGVIVFATCTLFARCGKNQEATPEPKNKVESTLTISNNSDDSMTVVVVDLTSPIPANTGVIGKLGPLGSFDIPVYEGDSVSLSTIAVAMGGRYNYSRSAEFHDGIVRYDTTLVMAGRGPYRFGNFVPGWLAQGFKVENAAGRIENAGFEWTSDDGQKHRSSGFIKNLEAGLPPQRESTITWFYLTYLKGVNNAFFWYKLDGGSQIPERRVFLWRTPPEESGAYLDQTVYVRVRLE